MFQYFSQIVSLSFCKFFCVTMMKMIFEKSYRESRNENAKKNARTAEFEKHNDFLQKSVRFYTLGKGRFSSAKKYDFHCSFFSDLSHQIKVNFHVGNKNFDYSRFLIASIFFAITVLWFLKSHSSSGEFLQFIYTTFFFFEKYSRSWT